MAGDNDANRLDAAARAGWLYFIAGKTQDEIARRLQVSRPTAQRLVSLAISERLITFRLEHPVARCMEMAARLSEVYGLLHCEVAPSDEASPPMTGVAELAAAFMEHQLRSDKPIIMAVGTGRSLRAAVDHMPMMNCPHHQLVSLVGSITPDGSASFFDVLSRLADQTRARHYPMPLPMLAASSREREVLLGLSSVERVHRLAEQADVAMVGVGQIDMEAPMFVDGFVTREELLDTMRHGAVGEVTSWCYTAEGALLADGHNTRVTSVRPSVPPKGLRIGVAAGPRKVAAIRAALVGRIINGLMTNEATAEALLEPLQA